MPTIWFYKPHVIKSSNFIQNNLNVGESIFEFIPSINNKRNIYCQEFDNIILLNRFIIFFCRNILTKTFKMVEIDLIRYLI